MNGLLRIGLCLVLAGCVGTTGSRPAASPTPSLGTHGAQTQGAFRLELVVPRATWSTAESIEGTATFTYAGMGSTAITGEGAMIVFSVDEVGGTRHVPLVSDLSCRTYAIAAGSPISTALTKSGAFYPSQPGASFVASFLGGPGFRLPPGEWDITANVRFVDTDGCEGTWQTLRAVVRVRVTG